MAAFFAVLTSKLRAKLFRKKDRQRVTQQPTPKIPKNEQPANAIHELGSPATPILKTMTPSQNPETESAVASTSTAKEPTQPNPPPTNPSPNPTPNSDAPAATPTTDQKPQANGASMPSKTPETQDKPDGAGEGENLSPAELKKRAKAEKAARRAKVKAEKEGPSAAPQQQPQTPQAKKGAASTKDGVTGQSQKNVDAGTSSKGQKQPGSTKQSQMRRGSVHGSISATEPKKKRSDDKNVAVFGHLYGQPRRTTIAGAGKEVHPAVLALGLQMRDYVICGSNARCIATLLAFKRVSFYLCVCGKDRR